MEKKIMQKSKIGIPLLTVFIIVFVIALVVTALVILLKNSLDSSVYSERSEMLSQLTESSAKVVNENLAFGNSLIQMFTDVVANEMSDYDSLETYYENISKRPGYADLPFFLVDSSGKYYSSDGMHGKIVDLVYYTNSSAEKVMYISTLPHMDNEKSYLVYRQRLAEKINITTQHGKADIVYCGILYEIDKFESTLKAQFSGQINAFIYDDSTGAMLYKHFGISLLIDGYNVYSKLGRVKLVKNKSADEIENACRNQETVIAAMDIGENEYYFCSSPIEHNQWSVAFIIQSQYLSDVSGSTFGVIVLYILLIAFILGAALVFILVMFYKTTISQAALQEIKELNVRLENATNAKTDFLSNMSHDIRTPINGIMGMTTIAKGVKNNPQKTVECLDKIEGATKHLLALINDVLDMSRIERGKTEISYDPMDLNAVCTSCCNIIKGQMYGRDLQLVTEIDCNHSRVYGDALHMRQILINMLGNAVKFTRDGGKIWLRARETHFDGEKTLVLFEVEDTGIGMSSEYVTKVFDAFTQEKNEIRSSYKGTGLGMAISKNLIELMHGTVKVESEIDKGSKFSFTIPFEIDTNEYSEKAVTIEKADITGVKVLLVEDNELNTDIAVELLEEAGAIVTAAKDGQSAVDTFATGKAGTFDIILMDVMMPVLNGLEACKIIRHMQREDAKQIPIIAMTANAFEKDIKATADAGMNAHLSKPININEVISTIAYYVNKA